MLRSCMLICIILSFAFAALQNSNAKKKKSLIDYNEADLEDLYDQWEQGDDPLEEDELPEWKRKPSASFDPSQFKDMEEMAKAMKKRKTLMIFVTVSGEPSPKELDDITLLWQTSLFNNHIEVQRFTIDHNRAIFMFKDGAQAWDAKDFLIKQDRCAEVTIEGKSYPGKAKVQKEL
ncbi:LDLR chaperone MESD [Trichinella patagoniensis]|uniref:LDLR chaperone MESD n=1 Tax=Trichinella patagoniensis TaxID=990121 RepID=A0A0V0ZI87_9BILA|nr:LDLR chaperone MESD [Trichinella patagoniensis]